MTSPQYISRAELIDLLRSEEASLGAEDAAWWAQHSVPPFPAQHEELWHYIVAAAGDRVIFFADDEDEFGIAKLNRTNSRITDCGLAGDLRDAVAITRTNAL